MRIRKDCLHYHEEPYMGARVDCCLAETTFGWCPCTPDCENYIPKDSSVRIVRCKDCRYHALFDTCSHPDGMKHAPDNGFCSYGKRRKK